jgi:hypothetical protein
LKGLASDAAGITARLIHDKQYIVVRDAAVRKRLWLATRRRREQEYADKLAKVKKWCLAWQARGKKDDWKTWVAGHSNIDRRFITQAVNGGKLSPPLVGCG